MHIGSNARHCQFKKSMNVWTIKVFLHLKVFSTYKSDSFEVFLGKFEQVRMLLPLFYHMKKYTASAPYIYLLGHQNISEESVWSISIRG